MAINILAYVLAASHIITVAIILLWFGLGKPMSIALFWSRFKERTLGIKTAKASVNSQM